MHPDVAAIQNMAMQGQYSAALEQLQTLDSALQQEVDALYIKAVCLRAQDERAQALQTLKVLLQQDPGHVRAYQEIGHVHVAAKNATKAIEGYAEAVRRDPALLSSWKPLVTLYKMAGDQAGMQMAQQQLATLEQMPPPLRAAKSALNQGDLEKAEAICREFLQKNKQHIEGMRLLAQIALEAKILDDAEFILESAVEFEPAHIGARFDLASVQLKRQKFGAAEKTANALFSERPQDLECKTLLASARLGVGDTSAAITLYEELAEANYQLRNTYLLLGHAYKTAGNLSAAVAAYQQVYQHAPDYGDAFWSLANTKTYQFTDDELAHMRDYAENSATAAVDKVHFSFALGKALEDRKEFAESFQYYERGNELNRKLLQYSAPDIIRRADRQRAHCTAALFEERAHAGCTAADPIFIVGLPRAGSTLLEQILASHSQVDGTLELPNILSLARRLRGRAVPKPGEEPQYPRILAELDEDYFRRFGEQYINDTRVFRQNAPFFIDKMPNNFLHIGLIKLILPNAKVIDARRHPMSCCFSGFKQLFAEGQEFTYGLKEIGTYYKAYVELMDHWDDVLPGFVLRVQHEDVVADLEGQVRRMLDFCGLEFEQSCVEYHKTERNIRTPSSEQVRQPIFTTALAQWKHYEKHLDPLKKALGEDVLSRYPI